MTFRMAAMVLASLLPQFLAGRGNVDRQHQSRVFGETRHYRLFLPPSYTQSPRVAYPVIYYFHGHSDRYTLEKYDDGKDTVPKIERFVAAHPVIVVAVDGYVAKEYGGFYGGAPWDISEAGGAMDFGAYFAELVTHIDSTFRTKPSRRYRATSGLSMGGFMSLYVSARFPNLVGSASAFNPGPEFFTGEPGRRILWRPKDHVDNHTATMIRLVRASGDYISQYHEETKDAYAGAAQVDFEYRRDEYHRHWATSIEETFDFHMRAFGNATLDARPDGWNYTCAYRECRAWGYRMKIATEGPCYVQLNEVSLSSFRITTRAWAPDGPPCKDVSTEVLTTPRYAPNAVHQVRDLNLRTLETRVFQARSDEIGRLKIEVDGNGHQLSIVRQGAPVAAPVMLPFTASDALRVDPGQWISLPIRLYNPGDSAARDLSVKIASDYPTVEFEAKETTVARLDAGQVLDVGGRLRARFTSGDGYYMRVRIQVTIGGKPYDRDVLVVPSVVPEPWEWEILDGRTKDFSVFRQKGNQGGGASVSRAVTEGKGNGNGVLEAGEQATIWVRLKQGLDPFDKGNWYRTKIRSDSACIQEIADLREQKQLEWTGAKERTSLIELTEGCSPGTSPRLMLDNESWSYQFTPDVRYGREPLYQAFQKHRRHLWRMHLTLPKHD